MALPGQRGTYHDPQIEKAIAEIAAMGDVETAAHLWGALCNAQTDMQAIDLEDRIIRTRNRLVIDLNQQLQEAASRNLEQWLREVGLL